MQAKAIRQNLEATAKALGVLTAVLERVNGASRTVNNVIAPEHVTARELSAEDAAALLRPDDTLAIPLGPGAPGGSCTRSATRDDWEQLEVFGALLLDLYASSRSPACDCAADSSDPRSGRCATRAHTGCGCTAHPAFPAPSS